MTRFQLVTTGTGSGIFTDRPLSGAYLIRNGLVAEVRFSWHYEKLLQLIERESVE